MAILRGCELPEDLLYWPEHHLWLAPEGEGGGLRLGITPLGLALQGEMLVFSAKSIGARVNPGDGFGILQTSEATVSLKAPVALELLDVNPVLEDDAMAVNEDPYGVWLAHLRPLEAYAAVFLPLQQALPAMEAALD